MEKKFGFISPRPAWLTVEKIKKFIFTSVVFVLAAFNYSARCFSDNGYRAKLSGTYICEEFFDNDSLKGLITLTTKGTYKEHWQFKKDILIGEGVSASGKWHLKADTLILSHIENVEVILYGGKHKIYKVMSSDKYNLTPDSSGFYYREKKFRKLKTK